MTLAARDGIAAAAHGIPWRQSSRANRLWRMPKPK